MQFTSTVIVALLAVSTSTVTAAQTTSNLRGGRVSFSILDAVITAAPSSFGVSHPAMGTAETAVPSSLEVSLPAMGTAETAVPSSLYSIPDAVITAAPSSSGVSHPAMGTAETAAPSSLEVSLPAMGTAETAAPAETALFSNQDRSLYAGCPGADVPAPSSFCSSGRGCGDNKKYRCCAKDSNASHLDSNYYCHENP